MNEHTKIDIIAVPLFIWQDPNYNNDSEAQSFPPLSQLVRVIQYLFYIYAHTFRCKQPEEADELSPVPGHLHLLALLPAISY